jgi:hypothetical protein
MVHVPIVAKQMLPLENSAVNNVAFPNNFSFSSRQFYQIHRPLSIYPIVYPGNLDAAHLLLARIKISLDRFRKIFLEVTTFIRKNLFQMWQRFSLEFSSRTEDTHYRILGVSRGATNEEIRSAFKARALQFHPDKNPNNLEAEIKIRLINQAIAVRQSFIHSYLSTLK